MHLIVLMKKIKGFRIESPYGQDALQNKQFTASNRDAPHQQDAKYKIDRKTP
jgi:hypothetical protein